MYCPQCKSFHNKKNGFRGRKQSYKCQDCSYQYVENPISREYPTDTRNGKEEFLNSPSLQDAILFRLQTIGEAVNQLPDVLKEKHPEILWRQIVGFRNLLAHVFGNENTLPEEFIRSWLSMLKLRDCLNPFHPINYVIFSSLC